MEYLQNLVFEGSESDRQGEETVLPPGKTMTDILKTGLTDGGWTVSESELWNEDGWEIHCSKRDESVQVCLASVDGPTRWKLQIGPLLVPGFLAKLFGKRPSAFPEDVFLVAKDVHRIMEEQPGWTGFRWRINGDPSGEGATPAPVYFQDDAAWK